MSALQDALGNLEAYTQDYSLGLLAAALSDPIVTSLAIGALARDRRIKQFFLAYAATRTVNTVANAIVAGAHLLLQSQTPPTPPQ